MNLRDLHYFVVLAEIKHFGEAANRCFVSQPTLSMQIKKLEDSLGVILFERNNKQVLLTDQGKQLLEKARKVLLLVDDMKDLARESSDPFSGDLRLGVIPTVSPYLLPLVMSELNHLFPKLKIWLIEEQTHRLITELEHGNIDAAIMAVPVEASFEYRLLYEEEFYFACSRANSLSENDVIQMTDLSNQRVMLLAEGHCLRDQAMAVCQLARANDIADFTATSLETLRLMVQAGMGVTLLPALSVKTSNTPNLVCRPFAKPAPLRCLALYWRKSTPKRECLGAISDVITAQVHDAMKSGEF
ncbi:LysR substrate-binding domain-containing protein [Legionella waltersii]|uniref:Hydrogen peroxide-inducible activator n=1 Tax=Legionella waltersii TaxID=66969 RepID=A0A0W1AB24_9GAMM|nr:LysR substrate-binding domain-containing protein [Legionella waltersii]KTD78352.1 hydrogen peroxide-inducible activator [Legionella waltersii]SNV06504.1 hydrogen peroxide-inducible genes activator [Legionella waltersii]